MIPNRLIHENSPYLLQHAHNPVNWYPWGSEAHLQAKKSDLPIFLSIGYAACHWCHVMEEECFKDQEVADLLNLNFIAIKVDREQHPEIDRIYMSVCQVMTGSGGWPLSIFLTPELKPFYAATYIPKKSRHNIPGMTDLIPHIIRIWNERREEVNEESTRIFEILSRRENPAGAIGSGATNSDEPLHSAYQKL
ncbi:MAG: thioredoxin domain-containing protein, partial [Methanospirillum sp.]|uniref:thioredoxin domain-containing protein n=1 Tax=Methanospirillum sp. TaxID=45200 RepID=UPI002370080D